MSKKNGSKATKKDTQVIMESLEVPLTETELKAASKSLAEALRAKAEIEAEIDTFKAQKKAQVTRLEGEIALNAGLVNTEKAFRMVECEVAYDWDRSTKTVTRMDTGEEIRTEAITNAERQQFFPEAEPVLASE